MHFARVGVQRVALAAAAALHVAETWRRAPYHVKCNDDQVAERARADGGREGVQQSLSIP